MWTQSTSGCGAHSRSSPNPVQLSFADIVSTPTDTMSLGVCTYRMYTLNPLASGQSQCSTILVEGHETAFQKYEIQG